jgi:hypothetical protein
MRSMNLLQMAGGVAVAGVVAAGTTAFTATAGVTMTGAKAPMMGGSSNITVTGPARLTQGTFRFDATTPNRVTGIAVTLDDGASNALANTSSVQVAFNGTVTGAPATGVYFACTFSSGQTWNCDIPTPASNYYTAVNSVDVWVQPVTA